MVGIGRRRRALAGRVAVARALYFMSLAVFVGLWASLAMAFAILPLAIGFARAVRH